ncbi:MAG: hydrolase [Gemmatimonadaceae bacterium]
MAISVYRPAWFVPGAHLQTLWGKLVRRRIPLFARMEQWETPDGDFVEIHRAEPPRERNAPRLLMLHGLEGTPRSHYVGGVFAEARRRGWGADLLVFRGCGAELNRARRFYHSGETTDLDFVVRRIVGEYPGRPLLLCGVSLGGNVLLKWLGEQGDEAPAEVRGAAAVSVPYDLARGCRHIQEGFSRVYDRHFVRSLVRKVRRKRSAHPDLPSDDVLAGVRTLWDFDDAVTAPVHGFRDAKDYYARSSSLGFLAGIRVPTLLLSAADDPFLPREVLAQVETVARANPAFTVEFTEHGGHVGFVSGRVPWKPVYYAERRVAEFLAERLTGSSSNV